MEDGVLRPAGQLLGCLAGIEKEPALAVVLATRRHQPRRIAVADGGIGEAGKRQVAHLPPAALRMGHLEHAEAEEDFLGTGSRIDFEVGCRGDRAVSAAALVECRSRRIGVECPDRLDPVGSHRRCRQRLEAGEAREGPRPARDLGRPLQLGFGRQHGGLKRRRRGGFVRFFRHAGGGSLFRWLRRRRFGGLGRRSVPHAGDGLERLAAPVLADAPVAEDDRLQSACPRRRVDAETSRPGEFLFAAEQIGGRLAAVAPPMPAPVEQHPVDLWPIIARRIRGETDDGHRRADGAHWRYRFH